MKAVLNRDQQKVLQEALAEADNFGAKPRERKALVEALSVESNIQNLNYGDRDSRGPLQQRPSQGWKHPNNVKLAVRDFLVQARKNEHVKGSAGVLAQSVQRSAFPGRYDERGSLAEQLLGSQGGGISGASARTPSIMGYTAARTVSETVADPEAEKRVALANHLMLTNPHSILLRLGVVSPNEPVTQTISHKVQGQPLTRGQQGAPNSGQYQSGATHKVVHFEGTKVAGWIAPILDYARQKGWKGKINSGYRSYADQQRIYNSGVRPAAKPGTSNHEFAAFPGGAVDVSDAETLNRILQNSPYKHKLVWAGGKDPVHFSHPHNGGY
jgi:hypothetical protein